MLLLTVGLPVLLAAGALWTVGQHRDPGGAFRAHLEELDVPGQALIVEDLDGLLARDAAFARAGRTEFRITAGTDAGPAFVGLAPAGEAAAYLRPARHTRFEQLALTTGPLPVRVSTVAGARTPAEEPARQDFWTRSGDGTLAWTADEIRDRDLALVIMTPDGRPAGTMSVTAELRPTWLTATTWGGLGGGLLLIIAGMAVLARPSRPRELVYVVDSTQLPDVAASLGSRASVIHPGENGMVITPVGHRRNPGKTADLWSRPAPSGAAAVEAEPAPAAEVAGDVVPVDRAAPGDSAGRDVPVPPARPAGPADPAEPAVSAASAGAVGSGMAGDQVVAADELVAATPAGAANTSPEAEAGEVSADGVAKAAAAAARPATLADAAPPEPGEGDATGDAARRERPAGGDPAARPRGWSAPMPPVAPQLTWPPLTRDPAEDTKPPIPADVTGAPVASGAARSPGAAAVDGEAETGVAGTGSTEVTGVAVAGMAEPGSAEAGSPEPRAVPRRRVKAQAEGVAKAPVKRAAGADTGAGAGKHAAPGGVVPGKRQPRRKAQPETPEAAMRPDVELVPGAEAAGTAGRPGSGGTPAAREGAEARGEARTAPGGPAEATVVPVEGAAAPVPRAGRRRRAADGEVRGAGR
ncbi:hypothetical protein [Catenuloplanes atrovinosus]|uniref:Uncharacterized protein n=1 Tax=Catenuloplanes atrovinosus TaxID=137266 RepID=A0AAE3YV31_9ACTN|nr:hypothetical protein [Catenuloplanes atrovinosus]MDR7278964.1 hypothetical protein [Catenuloplanes atrovinosus]